jgi:Xaa-Pro aminopeptidase
MAALGIDGLVLSGVDAQEAIGGHRRIRVFQSDPPGPGFVLCRSGPPHVCTPDPEGALHLPSDHVHPIAFDGRALGRCLPVWLGPAATGVLALDRAAPDAYAMVEAACPDATVVDAARVLLSLGLRARPLVGARARDADDLLQPRRARVTATAESIGVDAWWFRTTEAVRMLTGRRGPGRASVVGDVAIADSGLDAALEHFPARGRLAVDRMTVAERERLRTILPEMEIVDGGAMLLAGSTPRSAAETSALREGYRRTEAAVEAMRLASRSGTSERTVAAALSRAGAQLGLEPHIEHVITVVPRDRDGAPWLRGAWETRAPWRQLSSDRAIEPGDLVALDAGFFFDGYTTDFGWTFTVDREPTSAEVALADRWTDVADRVTEAVRPGATAADLRAAALAGWDEPEPPWPFGLYVAHGVGFGGVVPPFAGTDLGVAVERTMVLEPGGVLMIEPYIYEAGAGGYRAERCVAVTDTGSEVFTTLPIERLSPLAPT